MRPPYKQYKYLKGIAKAITLVIVLNLTVIVSYSTYTILTYNQLGYDFILSNPYFFYINFTLTLVLLTFYLTDAYHKLQF